LKNSQWSLVMIAAGFIFTALLVFVARGFPLPVTFSGSSQVESIASGNTNGKLNINTATVSQLTLLPNIGTTLAQRIVDCREQLGGFSRIEDLLLVDGIGEKRLEELRDYITTGG